MDYKSISVFLPALNEQENIRSCVLSVKKFILKKFKSYEIIVVSSGSTDNTEEIVRELSKKDQCIKLIRGKDRGYGLALRAGFAASTKDLIFYTDGDNQFKIEDLDKLLPLLQRFDIVSGYRIKRKDPFMRIFVAAVYNLLIRILFNLNVRDIDSSFKLFKKNVIADLNLKSKTGLIDAEVLIKASKRGYAIGQVGVNHFPRRKGQTIYAMGRSNGLAIVKPKVIIDILKEIKTLWTDLR